MHPARRGNPCKVRRSLKQRMVAEGRYAHGITPDWICPERLRLLRFAKAVSNDHGEILVGLRSFAVTRRPEIFEALMKQVKEIVWSLEASLQGLYRSSR